MLNLKHLSRWLYVVDMAVCCDLCGNDTVTAPLSQEDVYVKQLWHDPVCPLYGSKEAYDHWNSESEPKHAQCYLGKVEAHSHGEGVARKHTCWLRTDEGKLLRLYPVQDAFDSIRLGTLDGASVLVLGNAVQHYSSHDNGSVLYFTMMLDRSLI
jgi:hypothetical protein